MAIKPNKIVRGWVRETKPFEREVSNYDFYNSRAWRKVSKQFRLKNCLCKQCELMGEVSVSTVTDHIVPIARGGSKLDISNLQALCSECHNKKSSSERGGMGVKKL